MKGVIIMTNVKKNTNTESRATTILRGYCGKKRRAPLAEMLGMSRTTLINRINHPEDFRLSELIMLQYVVGLPDEVILAILHELRPSR